ncbi:MAG: leucine-rich repeat domain-containing protein [Planctomycetota bacterium]
MYRAVELLQKIEKARRNRRKKKLELSCFGETHLPTEIGQLTHIEELALSSDLVELPQEIAQLQRLRKLTVSGKLLSILNCIGQLSKLETLVIRDASLTSLPDTLADLAALHELELTECGLRDWPPVLSQMKQLQSLELRGNLLSEVDLSQAKLEALQYLGLAANELVEVPAGLDRMPQLSKVTLWENPIHEVPDASSQLLDFGNSDGDEGERLPLANELAPLDGDTPYLGDPLPVPNPAVTLPWYFVTRDADGRNEVHACCATQQQAERASRQHWQGGVDRVVLRASAALDVTHHGWPIQSEAAIAARELWVQRYARLLATQIKRGRRTRLFLFEHAPLTDPRSTYQGAPGGPCPIPDGRSWPTCHACGDVPMAFHGCLDFRRAQALCAAPEATLVAHVCQRCAHPHLEWLAPDEPYQLVGEACVAAVRIGAPYEVTDLPVHPKTWEKLEECGERSSYNHVTICATKIGGHPLWDQHDETPRGFAVIGQLRGTLYRDIGDSGAVTICHNPKRGETVGITQFS